MKPVWSPLNVFLLKIVIVSPRHLYTIDNGCVEGPDQTFEVSFDSQCAAFE